MFTRRDFIKTTALAGAGLALFKGSEGTAWAFSQSPLLRKFISPLPGLGADGIPVANASKIAYLGADFYQLAAVQFQQQMHPDLPNPTTLWGYMDRTTGKSGYLGPIILAERGRPVLMQMKNMLPPHGLMPVDTTLDSASGPQNRMVVHLHGGHTPWTSDGGPFAWFTPTGTGPGNGGGEDFLNGVPGMPGVAQYYYPNDQSARLMWYHDHAMGTTRLNAYAGMASGYLLSDPVVDSLTSGNAPLVPPLEYTIPLIIQDKTFKVAADQWGRPGDLWYPYQYESDPVTGRWPLGTPSDGFPNLGPPPAISCVPEYFSDTPVINGEAYPVLQVEPRRYRFVILNGSQARMYNLSLFYESQTCPKEANFKSDGPAFIQIGNEGGLLPFPVAFAKKNNGTYVNKNSNQLLATDDDDNVNPDGPYNLLMAPAERADLIIDFSNVPSGSKLILYNDAPAPFPGGDFRNDYYTGDPDQTAIGGAPSTLPGFGPNTRTLMEIQVVALKGSPDPWNFASTLNALSSSNGLPLAYKLSHPGEPDLDPNGPNVLHENKTTNEDYDSYGRLIQRVGTDQMLYADSYGRDYMDPPTEVYHNGQVVVWDVYNTTGDTHPMHIHLANMLVLGKAPFTNVGVPDGPFAPPDPNYRGWKETVRMNPGQVTRVIVQWKLPSSPFPVPPSPRTGGNEYVWHCHILEHEEHDMMRPIVILP